MWGELRVDESFPSVEMRVVSPSVESVMKLLVYSTFFLRWLFKCSLIEDGGQLTKPITSNNAITRKTKILFKNERETSPVQWVTGTNCTINLFTGKK